MSRRKNKKNIKKYIVILVSLIFLIISAYFGVDILNLKDTISDSYFDTNKTVTYFNLADIPKYTDKVYVKLNNNVPYFRDDEYVTKAFESYSKLDKLGRCGVAYANICKEIMPTEERKNISDVKPTGWVQAKYNGEYLYNRCHLIGHMLAGEDANDKNLITGTRYFNVEGMLPFENIVANYIKENELNHVLYRVTPVFEGDNLVASGVEIEAYSVEDNGEGVCFNVYVYNVQPGIEIDYKTGKSSKNN